MKIVLFLFFKIFIDMKKNIVIIKESQYKTLQKRLAESQMYTKNVKLILNDLVNNYEPIITPVGNGSEFTNEKRIKKKIDGSEINPAQLFDYYRGKFLGVSDEFIQQVIKDWFNGDIGDDLTLSRNVPIN